MSPFEQLRSTNRSRSQFIVMIALLILAVARITAAQSIPTAGQLQVGGEITIVFTANTVSCSGLAPNHTVSLVGFMIDRQSGSQSITTPTFSQLADSSGAFSATIAGGIKPRSIWLLIDQNTGAYTVAEPEGSVLTQIPEATISIMETVSPSPVATIRRSHTHAISISIRDQLTVGDDSLRPGNPTAEALSSAFTVADAKDGSASDSDGAINGGVDLNLPNFLDSHQTFAFLFVVDDRTLEFSVTYFKFLHGVPCRQAC
ncbi:MAG TPA: hypothetical protein VGQ65_05090 [Thermoanaerobaculia bacterium]|jgi:hypothetical protein|nr:hypothetical protein [Thermoanaerobaculia bacterium]